MNILEKVKQLPQQSGVYLFKDKTGKIIYIGKAISLRNRVSSYFNKSYTHSLKVSQMINMIDDVDYIITGSEMEALLLESRLVKTKNPYFNTQLKDDKSYPYIKITCREEYPAIQLVRKNRYEKDKKARYFGPFVDVEVTKKAVKKLREIFKLRNCSNRKIKMGTTCLDYQINLCSAPCAQKINRDDYRKKVDECCLLLTGQHNQLLKDLKDEMKIVSQLMLFEKAAKIRDTIQMIEKVIDQGKISKHYKKKVGSYLINTKNHSSLNQGLHELQDYLNLQSLPKHIEAYDISNIHGQISVGSLVVFTEGVPDKKRYRHYKIKEVKGINDFAMMREVLYRRFRDSKAKKDALPDLVLLDGGKGQLNIGIQILQELGIKLDIASLAKREEEIFRPGEKDSILLPENSESLFLMQRIRDEAHRFAIGYHKRLRSKQIKNSVIDFIPGIGDKRKRQLLSKFKSIDDIRNAKQEELKEIPGIGDKTARKIKDILEVRHDYKL
ncbi:MAG: excinuclease ABC subunit UvrC [Atribacterota bacterium]|nr:excinuclease ABC subunit UvrC [Atribacterota bacterium]